MGTPNREPKEHSNNMLRDIPIRVHVVLLSSCYILGFPCLGSAFKSFQFWDLLETLELGCTHFRFKLVPIP